MNRYNCSIVNELGAQREILILADNEQEVHTKIPSDSYLLATEKLKNSGNITQVDLLSFTSQLSSLVRSGVGIPEALLSISTSQNPGTIISLSQLTLHSLKEGHSLSTSMKLSGLKLPSFYIPAIEAGEETNSLPNAIDFLYSYIKDKKATKNKVISAITYPIMVFAIAMLATGYLLSEVVPEMARNYKVIGQELPEITKIIIAASDLVKSYGLYAISLIFGSIIAIKTSMIYVESVRESVYKIIYSLPLIGKLVRVSDIYTILTTTSLLLKHGISIDVALNISKSSTKSPVIYKSLDSIISKIRSGQSISSAVWENRLLDKSTIGILKAGEIGNSLSDKTQDIASIYKERQDKALGIITTVIGPLSILFVGAIILTVALGMLMPMFNLNDMDF